MKILVTGSNGQVGRSILELSTNKDFEFLFADRNSLDITNKNEVEQFIEKYKPNIIINAAAYTAVDNAESDKENCYAVNHLAVKYLAQSLTKLNLQNKLFIHISSDYVYHPDHINPILEKEPTNPKGVYAASKLEGDQISSKCFENTIILRTSWVYAKTGNNFVNTMKRLCLERPILNVVDDQIGSPTYAPDIAYAILHIVQDFKENPSTAKSGIYNFSNEGFTSWYEFASEINTQIKGNCKINPIPTADYPTPAARPLNSRLNKSKITDTWNIELVPWKIALQKCLTE